MDKKQLDEIRRRCEGKIMPYVMDLLDEIDRLNTALKDAWEIAETVGHALDAVRAERDAAVADLKSLSRDYGDCDFCDHEKCYDCCWKYIDGGDTLQWQWRGPAGKDKP